MKIYVGSIVYRTVEVPHYDSMIRFHKLCQEAGIEVVEGIVRGDALVERSRSIAASAFLRSDCDVMLSIDSDIWFRPVDAIALCQKAMEKQVIGALYMTRSLNTQPALMLPDHPVVLAGNAEPVETPYVSTGFMAVARPPLEALQKTLPLCHQTWGDSSFWPFYLPYVVEWPDDGHILLSEDWAFCQRVKDAGFPVYLDPSIRLVHHGDYGYTLEDLVRPPKPSATPLMLTRRDGGQLDVHMLAAVEPKEARYASS